MFLNKNIYLLAVATGALCACSDSSDYDFDRSLLNAQTSAVENASPAGVYDPATGQLPFPNSLLFTGSEDGTLNIPLGEGVAADDFGNPSVALNAIDGFSTTEPVVAQFGGAVDPATVTLGETVFVYRVSSNAQGIVTGVDEVLGADRLHHLQKALTICLSQPVVLLVLTAHRRVQVPLFAWCPELFLLPAIS